MRSARWYRPCSPRSSSTGTHSYRSKRKRRRCPHHDYGQYAGKADGYVNLVNLLGGLPLTFGTYLWSPDYNGLDDFIWEFFMEKRPLE